MNGLAHSIIGRYCGNPIAKHSLSRMSELIAGLRIALETEDAAEHWLASATAFGPVTQVKPSDDGAA